MSSNDNDTNEYPPSLMAVIAWVTEYGIEWGYIPEESAIAFSFMRDGFRYSATALEKVPDTLTVTIVLELPEGLDELTLRRRISEVDIQREYGALIFNHELWLIIWRDSIYSEDGDEFDVDLVMDVLTSGIGSMEALRLALADMFGENIKEVSFAQMPIRGSA
jgi:hypothetical protein